MADALMREQPGTVPGPRHDNETPRPGSQDGALAWSVTAMSDALRRLAAADTGDAADMPRTVAAATEAVWWVTVVDAAMTRHHPGAYGRALAVLDPAPRRAVEDSLAGLRFIRSQLGYSADPGDFIQPPCPGAGPAAEWTWSAASPPPPQRGKAREASPYREYRAQLAGRPVAGTLERAAGFLAQAHATASRPRHHRAPASTGQA